VSDFAPSLARAHAAGAKVVKGEYPVGVAGVKLSLEQIALKIREGRNDPDVRGWAGDVLLAAGKPQGVHAQAQAILDAFRKQCVYVSDPVGSEYVSSAAATLCLRPGLCVRAFDCDDGVVAVGSALMSIGIPVHVIKQTFGAGDQEHVLLEAQAESGAWLPIDPSTENSVGWKAPASQEFVVDPMAPNLAGLSGLPDAEFVGIGKVTHVAYDAPHHTLIHVPRAAREVLGLGACASGKCCAEEATGKPCNDCVSSRGVARLPPRVIRQGVGVVLTASASNGQATAPVVTRPPDSGPPLNESWIVAAFAGLAVGAVIVFHRTNRQ
jgi:hypothetical protein